MQLFELPALSFDVNLFRCHGNFFDNREDSKCPLLEANSSRNLVTFEFFLSNFHKCEKRARKIREQERENEDPRRRTTPPRAKVRIVRLG